MACDQRVQDPDRQHHPRPRAGGLRRALLHRHGAARSGCGRGTADAVSRAAPRPPPAAPPLHMGRPAALAAHGPASGRRVARLERRRRGARRLGTNEVRRGLVQPLPHLARARRPRPRCRDRRLRQSRGREASDPDRPPPVTAGGGAHGGVGHAPWSRGTSTRSTSAAGAVLSGGQRGPREPLSSAASSTANASAFQRPS